MQFIIFIIIVAAIVIVAPGILKVLLEEIGKGIKGLWNMFHKD